MLKASKASLELLDCRVLLDCMAMRVLLGLLVSRAVRVLMELPVRGVLTAPRALLALLVLLV